MPPTSGARLRDARVLAALGLAAGITVPAALLGGPQAGALPSAPVPAALAADEQPVCGDPGAKDFPIDTRIQGAPGRYASGGGYGTWFLDLTNTTDAPCRALHPVLVLADRDRRLTSDQIQLEFSEPGRPGTEHRVTWESTDHDEQIGVFGGDAGDVGDPGKRGEKGERGEKRGGGGEEAEKGTSSGTGTGTGTGTGSDDSGDSGDSTGSDDSADSGEAFLGFTVPAGKTVSVRVRMAFTSDTAPGPVTAHAAVVQRRHQDKAKGGGREDGEWVGESEEYPFVIIDGATGGIREPERPRPERPRTESPQPERPQRESPEPEGPRAEEPRPERTGPGAGTRTEGPGGTDTRRTDPGADQGPSPSPDRDSTPRPPTRPADGDEHGDGGRGENEGGGVAGEDRGEGRRPGLPPRDGPGSPLPELARTGPVSLTWTGVTAGALLVGGAALVLHARRLRRLTD